MSTLVASQQLSHAAAAAKRRAAARPFTKTHAAGNAPTVRDEGGALVPWAELMESLLVRADENGSLPAHPSLETFEVNIQGDHQTSSLGLRVAHTAAPLEAHTFLGIYQGWVGTRAESVCLVHESVARTERSLGAPSGVCWMPSRPLLLQRLNSLTHWMGYFATLDAPPGTAGGLGSERHFVVSPRGRGGHFIGNVLCRINDGKHLPCALPAGAPVAPTEEDSGLLARAEEEFDRPSNVRFVSIHHRGWVYLGVMTSARVEPGEELLLSCEIGARLESAWALISTRRPKAFQSPRGRRAELLGPAPRPCEHDAADTRHDGRAPSPEIPPVQLRRVVGGALRPMVAGAGPRRSSERRIPRGRGRQRDTALGRNGAGAGAQADPGAPGARPTGGRRSGATCWPALQDVASICYARPQGLQDLWAWLATSG